MNTDSPGLGPDLTKEQAASGGTSDSGSAGSPAGGSANASAGGSAGASAGSSAGASTGGWAPTPRARGLAGRRELRRPIDDRMLAGVAAGIADYLDVDVTLVRIALAVLVFVGGVGLPLYLAGWLLIPEEGAAMSIAGDLVGSFENRSS